jgi:hypothetical protein
VTRVFNEGFEMRDYVGWTKVGGSMDINTTTKRSGVASMCMFSGIDLSQSNINYVLPSTYPEGYFRFAIYVVYVRFSNDIYCRFKWTKDGTVLGSIGFVENRVAILYNSSDVAVAYGTVAISASTWFLIEIHVAVADAGSYEVKINGIIDPGLTYSGDTKPGADIGFNRIYFWTGAQNNDGTTYYIDDIAINDVNGSVDNRWCGDGRIIARTPNGTITNQLVGSDGDSVNNHLLVDEIPSNSDTDYVQGNVVNEEDLYDFAATGLASTCTISRIWVESRSKNTVANGRKLALVTKASGGSEVVGSDVVLAPTYTIRCLGAEQTQNPVGPANWTAADVDALQAGVRTRS